MTTDETIITSFEKIEKEGKKKPYVTFITGPRLGQLVALEKEEIVVGRSPDCDLWVEDSAISRKHFKLEVREGKVSVEDLGSTNGTYVNGEPVKKAELNDGDKIQISRETILELAYLDESRSLSEKKRYEMGVMDPVTNIYNKRYFLDRIKEEFSFAKRKKRPLSLILFDLDFFKKLNDTYGHLAGDVVLQKVCAEVSRTIRTDDVFCRYGGEEFIIILRDTDGKQASDLAERIRKRVADMQIPYEGRTIQLTISCGISTLTEASEDFVALVSEADSCLYRSKREGRNRVTAPQGVN